MCADNPQTFACFCDPDNSTTWRREVAAQPAPWEMRQLERQRNLCTLAPPTRIAIAGDFFRSSCHACPQTLSRCLAVMTPAIAYAKLAIQKTAAAAAWLVPQFLQGRERLRCLHTMPKCCDHSKHGIHKLFDCMQTWHRLQKQGQYHRWLCWLLKYRVSWKAAAKHAPKFELLNDIAGIEQCELQCRILQPASQQTQCLPSWSI